MYIVDGVRDHFDHRFGITSANHYDSLVHVRLQILLQMEQETIEDSCILILSCSPASRDPPMYFGRQGLVLGLLKDLVLF